MENGFENTKKYLDFELEILEITGYDVGSKFLRQFPTRAKDMILGINRKKPGYSQVGSTIKEIEDELISERKTYLSKVTDYLIEKSKNPKYFPVHGSFPESIGKTLDKLAYDIRREI